jgi:peptidoglycan/xylan/chitin deacetylase (PgdA/CDA1 family)
MTPDTGRAPLATIVMYHVVRPACGLAARLKGLDADAFRGQLNYIRAHYTAVGLFDLVAAADGNQPLPPHPIVLTFDDGYAGHHDLVFPLLCETQTPAAFFPAASSMLDGHVLDVNKIQLILAVSPDLAPIVDAVDAAVAREARAGGLSLAACRAKWWIASRWDPPAVVYVKRLLQHALPEAVRQTLITDLFRRLVSADERSVAEELYMTAAGAREMRRAGMTIGAHGDRHLRLSTLSRDDQAIEIDGALRVLDAVGLPRRRFAYCYANGEYNDDSIALLRTRQCAIGLTIRTDLAPIVPGGLLALPRIDTNDLPVRADAEPAEWTRRAASSRAACPGMPDSQSE